MAASSSSSDTRPLVLLNRRFHEGIQPLVEKRFRLIVDGTFLDPALDAEEDTKAAPGTPKRAELREQVRGLLVHGHMKVDEGQLARFPNLVVVSNHGVGYDHISVPPCTARGIPVGNTPDVLTGATADMALALLLAVARRVVEGDKISRDPSTKAFDPFWFGKEVHGSTVGVIGMGRIGLAIARRCHHGFNMKVLYHQRRKVDASVEESLGGAEYCPTLESLVSRSDFVVLAAPATPETYRMLKAEHFAQFKKGSYFVNIARGSLVDQDALVSALQSGERLAGAGLDVTDPEPLPRDHPLLTSCPTCVITPHTGSATFQTRTAMCVLAMDNLEAGLKGGARDMPSCVNAEGVEEVRAKRGGAGGAAGGK